MSKKRMFSLSVIDTDNFLSMPMSTRLLYYELGMRADDDGFVDNWRKILMFTGLKDDDLKILIARQFIIPFETGVIVIRHWRLNNYLRADRYTQTNYLEEKSQLELEENGVYSLKNNVGIPMVDADKNSIDKNSIDKNSIDKYIVEQKSSIPYEKIIDYLNSKIKTNYKSSTNKTRELIKARFNENFTLEDFKKVIDKKSAEWLGTEMEKYLRPETLFSNKFESYLNQNIKKKESGLALLNRIIKEEEEKNGKK